MDGEELTLPDATDTRWKEVVLGKHQIDVEFFPLKLLLARQRLQLQISQEAETVNNCVNELRQLFLKNLNHPVARKDLIKIYGRRKVRRMLRRR